VSNLLKEERDSPTGGHIIVLTLNRPEALNSFSRALLSEMEETVDSIYADRTARCVILTGNGRAFCTGADLKERATMNEGEVKLFLRKIGQLFGRLENLPVPVIAAINGFALGGGLEIALCCDLRLASRSAVIGLTETSLGIIPGAGGTQRLSRLIGLPGAKELIFTARKISAEKAMQMGILSDVVGDEELLDAALKLALEICSNAPVALAQAKFALDHGYDTDLATGIAIESKAYEITIPTKDRTEALEAFKAKRRPNFTGM